GLGGGLRLHAGSGPRLRRDLSQAGAQEFHHAVERGRARGAARAPRPLRGVQPALRPRHHLRAAHRRQCRGDPVLAAAGGEVAVSTRASPQRTNALTTIVTPPPITTRSRIAVCTCNGRRSISALARKAPGSATPPMSSAIAITFALTTPASPKVANLTSPTPMEMTASVATTAAPSRPAAISSESRMMPAPTVPPASGPQPKPAAARPRLQSARPRLRISRRSRTHRPATRHVRHQQGAEDQTRAFAWEEVIAASAERAGRRRRDKHDQRPPPIDEGPKRRRPTGIGQQRRKRKDGHHRLGTHDRHQNQRHQRAGAVAGNPADDRRDERHGRDEGKLRDGDGGKNRGQRFEHRAKSYTNKSYTKRPSALTNPPPSDKVLMQRRSRLFC